MNELKFQKDDFKKLDLKDLSENETPAYGVSMRKRIMLRFLRNKLAMVSLIVIILLLTASFVIPHFYPYELNDQNLKMRDIGPVFKAYRMSDGRKYHFSVDMKVWLIKDTDGFMIPMNQVAENLKKKEIYFEYGDAKVMLNYNNKRLKLTDMNGQKGEAITVFNKEHIFGTDALGRDLFIRVLYGVQVSLEIAVIATLVNVLIGVSYGCIAGFSGGNIDNVMMRAVDIIGNIPLLLYVILLMVVIGAGLKSIIIAMSSVFWIGMARLVRGQVLSLKNMEYIQAAKSIGTGNAKIILGHLLPNILDQIILSLILAIPNAIFTEAFLSFIGLGIQEPLTSLGSLCNAGMDVLVTYPYRMFFPAVFICAIIFCFNFIGDGLRDAMAVRMAR
ncbi:MAG: ABC transporter permease [Eubacteriales bacterium]|nr:ABC transporter permease [Eubacteriales bacterium]